MSIARPAARAPVLPTQLVRFAVVGASNTAVTFITYTLLVLALPSPLCAALAWAAGAVNGYRWNHAWTFAAAATGGVRPAARYAVVQAAAAGLSAVLVVALHAELTAIGLTSVLAFVACRAWVFA
jgi:putative flippase GtrA